MNNELLQDLQWRGLIAQGTDLEGLAARMNQGPLTLYAGFDPTAVSLHVGNLIPLIALARFRQAGHHAIALVGGATGLVGDPSGKSAERVLQTSEQVAERTRFVQKQLLHFLDAGSDGQSACDFVVTSAPAELGSSDFTIEGFVRPRASVVNNLDWTANVSVLEFLRDIGKHFSVNAMIHRDSVKSRLEREGEGISFTEFSYMLLQAHDFLKLAETQGCELQIGGSDQWGNMCSGVDLIRRKLGREAFALTFPLLTMADGQKFGKTAKGAIWVDSALTSVWDFFQFWLNAEDADVIRLLKLFTFVPRAEIEALEVATRERPQAREAQRRLAREMTVMAHGEAAADEAERAAQVLFGKGDVTALSESTWAALAQSVPGATFASLADMPTLAPLLVALGLETSNTKATEVLKAGAVSLNNVKATDARRSVEASEMLFGRFLLVKKGKKHFALARVGA